MAPRYRCAFRVRPAMARQVATPESAVTIRLVPPSSHEVCVSQGVSRGLMNERTREQCAPPTRCGPDSHMEKRSPHALVLGSSVQLRAWLWR